MKRLICKSEIRNAKKEKKKRCIINFNLEFKLVGGRFKDCYLYVH